MGRHRFWLEGILGASLIPVVLSVNPVAAQITFSDQTSAAALNQTCAVDTDMYGYRMDIGGTVGDFDRDGWPDLFLLGGGGVVDSLFVNNRDGTFTDRAAEWGVAIAHRGHAATAGDFNNDGWLDIYATSAGDMTDVPRSGQHRLYRNNGNGTFTDVASTAGVHLTSTTSLVHKSPAFGDYDLDGDLDLFVATWSNTSHDGNRLFLNNGDETFNDVTVAAGVLFTGLFGFSPRFADMNGDFYPELLIAADFGSGKYLINDTDGTFTDATSTSGTGLDSNGMGSTIADFDNNGLFEWYVTSIYRDVPCCNNGNYLYVNQGGDVFSDLPESAGAKNGGWGWGTDARDFDHDGFFDIAETNGWGGSEFENETAYLFRNNGNLTFTEVHASAGLVHTLEGRSLMTLDYDRDGDMDIVITAFNAPVYLFRNEVSGAGTNWLEVFLDTRAEPMLAPDGFGTKVTVTSGGVSRYYYLSGGATYLGQSELVAHFGLGADSNVDSLVIAWSNGATTTLTDFPANQIVTASPSVSGAPGEASAPGVAAEQMIAEYNPTMDRIEVSYTPGCDSSNHTIYYGDIADVATHGYAGAACWRGGSAATSFDPDGLDNAFFVVVANTGFVEGSYGRSSSGERPEDLGTIGCNLPQDLTAVCDLP